MSSSLPLFLFDGFFTSPQAQKEDVIDFDLVGKQSGVMRNRDMHDAGRVRGFEARERVPVLVCPAGT